MAFITFQPSDHFNTKIYTGNGSAGNAQTGVGFQPDLVWYKARSQAYNSGLFDVIRGASKQLYSDQNSVEATYSGVTSFDSDGFTLGTDAGGNGNGETYVAWNWKAGNSQGSSNTDGSINTTYTSVNTTAGFSISKYTGNGIADATVGHGLGAKVDFLLIKDLGNASNWIVGHKDTFTTGEIYLNQTNALSAAFGPFNKTAPTTSVFNLGTDVICNGSGRNYIAYAFATKKGFSKFGSYSGNGSTDGTFVYTGFKPAFLIQKRTDTSGGNWNLYDNKRSTAGGSNVIDDLFYVDANNAEVSHTSVDFLSNGFKFRSSDGAINAGENIYMAFAEEPLVSSNNIPATAR
tara:strand:+ start:32 stop:1072 length:1041 start_codon:yes stop_codon:yes gene_type:complete